MSRSHAHRSDPRRRETRPFTGPIASALRSEPRAHGNVCRVDHCRCGAVRRTNINAGYEEVGPWAPDDQRETSGGVTILGPLGPIRIIR